MKLVPIAQAGKGGDQCEKGVGMVFAEYRQGVEDSLERLRRSRGLGGTSLGRKKDTVGLNLWVRFVEE